MSSGDFGQLLDELFGFGESTVTVPTAQKSASEEKPKPVAKAKPAAKRKPASKPQSAKAKPAAKVKSAGSAKPIQVERKASTGKKINGKDMIIYSAIMNPKFDE